MECRRPGRLGRGCRPSGARGPEIGRFRGPGSFLKVAMFISRIIPGMIRNIMLILGTLAKECCRLGGGVAAQVAPGGLGLGTQGPSAMWPSHLAHNSWND